MVQNVFNHPRTTLAAALSVALGAIMSQVVPALAAYFGAQPGVGWQLLGLVLGALPGAFMTDGKKAVPTDGKAPAAVLLPFVVTSMLIGATARADDVTPPPPPAPAPAPAVSGIPQLTFCLDAAQQHCFRPYMSINGVAYDLTNKEVMRSFQIGAGEEFTIIKDKLGIAVGPVASAGDNFGGGFSQSITLPYNIAVGVSELVVNEKGAVAVHGGYIYRF